jgi:hypothetical protein
MEEILNTLDEIMEQNEGRIYITPKQKETIDNYKNRSINFTLYFKSFDIYSDKSPIIKKLIENLDILNVSSFIRVNHTHAHGDDGVDREIKGVYKIIISGLLNENYSKYDLIYKLILIVIENGLFGRKEEEMTITYWNDIEDETIIYDGKIKDLNDFSLSIPRF